MAATAALLLLADQALALWRRRSTVQLAVPQAGVPGHWLQPIKTALAHVWRLPGLKQVIVLLNNLSQPVAGLVVGLFAGQADPRRVVIALTLGMGLLGASVVLAAFWLRRQVSAGSVTRP